MSNSINIRRDVQDSFYRYKMPKLQAKIEGKGNGIKTLIINMVDVAKALHRPPTYVTKYFGAEVGALTNWDEKEARYIVNGVHDVDKLQTLLDGFIKKFVLCPKCDNPETVLSVKNGIVFRTCKACGAKNPCDNLHKLATFIKTNPPPKPVKLKQAKDTAAAGIHEQSSAAKEENVEGMLAPEGFDDGLHGLDASRNVDEEDWDEAAAEANREAELAGLSERVKNSLALKDNTEDFKDPLEAFAEHVEAQDILKLTTEGLLEEASERGIRRDKAIAVATQIILAEETVKRLSLLKDLFTSLCSSGKDSQAFLGSLERILVASGRIPQFPACLQAIYMNDILDEEALLAWKATPSKKFVKKEEAEAVRKAAAPFFAWLEEDSDNEESDDEE